MNTTPTIQFTDGAAYERYMGIWSRMVGAQFLHWLSAVDGMRWLDVGCGNGAFTEMLAQHGAPSTLAGIDPSAEQLAFARTLPPWQAPICAQAMPWPCLLPITALMPP